MPPYLHLTIGTMCQNKQKVNLPNKESCFLDEKCSKLLLALVSSDGGNGGKCLQCCGREWREKYVYIKRAWYSNPNHGSHHNLPPLNIFDEYLHCQCCRVQCETCCVYLLAQSLKTHICIFWMSTHRRENMKNFHRESIVFSKSLYWYCFQTYNTKGLIPEFYVIFNSYVGVIDHGHSCPA